MSHEIHEAHKNKGQDLSFVYLACFVVKKGFE